MVVSRISLSIGALLMTSAFRDPSAAATTLREVLSVIWAIRPPSPICCRGEPMYSRPDAYPVKSLSMMPMLRG